jgi:hypothetical protein
VQARRVLARIAHAYVSALRAPRYVRARAHIVNAIDDPTTEPTLRPRPHAGGPLALQLWVEFSKRFWNFSQLGRGLKIFGYRGDGGKEEVDILDP